MGKDRQRLRARRPPSSTPAARNANHAYTGSGVHAVRLGEGTDSPQVTCASRAGRTTAPRPRWLLWPHAFRPNTRPARVRNLTPRRGDPHMNPGGSTSRPSSDANCTPACAHAFATTGLRRTWRRVGRAFLTSGQTAINTPPHRSDRAGCVQFGKGAERLRSRLDAVLPRVATPRASTGVVQADPSARESRSARWPRRVRRNRTSAPAQERTPCPPARVRSARSQQG